MLDVLGVHRYRPCGVAGFLGRYVLLDQAIHLLWLHLPVSFSWGSPVPEGYLRASCLVCNMVKCFYDEVKSFY